MNAKYVYRIVVLLVWVSLLVGCARRAPQAGEEPGLAGTGGQAPGEVTEEPAVGEPEGEEPAGEDTAEEEAAGEDAAVEQPDEVVTLTLGYLPQGSYSPIFVAIEKGYFAEQGIALEMQTFRTGAEMIAPISLGQLDVGAGEVGTAFLNGVSQGLSIRGVYPLASQRDGHWYLPVIVRKDLFDSGEVTQPTDLRGKKIAVNATEGMSEYFVAKALERGGLTVDDVELVTIPFPEMPQALANQAVDAGLITYPLAAVALSEGPNGEPPAGVLLVEDYSVEGGRTSNGVYYFGQRLLDPQNRELGVKFLMAVLKGARELQGDDWQQNEEIVSAIIKYTNTTPEVVQTGVAPFFDPNGQILRESVEDMQAYYVERGYTQYQEPMPFEQIIDTSFLEEALSRLGEYTGD